MLDVLVATVLFTLVVAIVVGVLVLVTVGPLYVALQMAESRRLSPGRWTFLTGLGVLLGLGLAYVLHGHDVPKLVPLLPLVLTWTGPLVLWLLDESNTRVGGRAGAHE